MQKKEEKNNEIGEKSRGCNLMFRWWKPCRFNCARCCWLSVFFFCVWNQPEAQTLGQLWRREITPLPGIDWTVWLDLGLLFTSINGDFALLLSLLVYRSTAATITEITVNQKGLLWSPGPSSCTGAEGLLLTVCFFLCLFFVFILSASWGTVCFYLHLSPWVTVG